jgi:hypothetical protein
VPVKKTIFQVEVDDTQFKAFNQLFQRYQEALAKLPEGWKKVAVGVGAVAEAHVKGAAAAEKQGQAIDKQVASVARAEQSSATISNNWRAIASNAHELDKTLERSVVKLAKWGGLAAGVLGGLGAVGIGASLFGIDKLAGSIGAARTAAMGLGITTGQNKAYNLNYGRLVGAGGIMSNISTAKYDFTSDQYSALLAAGVSPQDVKNKDPGQLFSEVMHNIPSIFAGVPKDQIGSVATGRGLTNIMSVQDIVAYLNASPDERAKIERDTQKDSKDLDLQDNVQRQWQDFVTQLSRATETMKTKLMDKLSIIEPGLEDLSKQVTAIVAKFIDSGAAKAAIDWLGVEIEKFANYVGKPEFQDDVKKFVDWVGSAADAVWKFVGYFAPTAANAAEVTMGDMSVSFGDSNSTLMDSATPTVEPTGAGAGAGASSNLRARGTGGGTGGAGGTSGPAPTFGDFDQLADGSARSQFSRGVQNFNPGNIMWGSYAAAHGATGGVGKDQDHLVAVFPDYKSGIKAMESLALGKYEKGAHTADELIAGQGGWTPGNKAAAANVASSMGLGPDDDLHLDDPTHMNSFVGGLTTQEVGPDGARYIFGGAHPKPHHDMHPDKPEPHHDMHQTPAKVSIHQATGSNVFASMFSIAQGFAPITA